MMLEEILEKTSAETELPKTKVREVIRSFFKYLAEEFKIAKEGESIRIQGYGAFKVVKRAPRKARNLKTGETVEIPAKKVLVFKPYEAFIEELKE